MNLVAIDIGNTNISVGLFLKGAEQSIKTAGGAETDKVAANIREAWEKIPVSKHSKEGKQDGVVIASSVKPVWTEMVRKIVEEELQTKLLIIGENIPFPIDMAIENSIKVGTDRIVAAAAAYSVVGDAVVVLQVGTAVTIDLVDENGVFKGGVIAPGFEASSQALKDSTAQLPKIQIHKPAEVYGKNTTEAINSGLYYSAIATLQEMIRRYAEILGRWPQTVLTGSGAALIKDDCEFIDSYVPNLVVKGIAFAYRKYLDEKSKE